ncbi:death-associated inhibitor of apoptosis 1-like [Frankliniella occidentalis]|uniref:Death-associated inhibitor of apoptosis 1-like n=1 Tax=Frankliniella occidentalis TaxID=133901 RepID=A0A9C6X7H5_FRAOC|nr:death-associated inhibitor of apoptosis 1-like [Frankliniella occidentalis]
MATPRRVLHLTVWRRGLHSEARRLATFHNFGPSFVSPSLLAKAGFHHINANVIKCAFCNIELFRLERGVDITVQHMKWSPFCEFVRGLPVGNIPILGSSLKASDCGPGFRWADDVPPVESMRALGIVEQVHPLYPKYILFESRVKTFYTWPVGLALKPNDLARAGFFYTGCSDALMCHHCGGKLQKLHAKITVCDLWKMHAKSVPTCEFVIVHKGILFVNAASEWSEACIEERGDEPAPASPPASPERVIKCKICLDLPCQSALIPCGHMCTCFVCYNSVRNCPVCRADIVASVRIHVP